MAGDSKALVKKEGGNRRERRANEKSKVDNTHRRTWDKDDYEERAAAREKVPGLCIQTVPWHSQHHSDLIAMPSLPVQVEQEEEESAIDAKRRKRLGTLTWAAPSCIVSSPLTLEAHACGVQPQCCSISIWHTATMS